MKSASTASTVAAMSTTLAIAAPTAAAVSIASFGGAALSATAANSASIAALYASLAMPVFAEGIAGLVIGAGTGTSDSILARISNGESVVTASATKQYTPQIAAMNAGTYSDGSEALRREVAGLREDFKSLALHATIDAKGITATVESQQKKNYRRRVGRG